MQIFHLSGAFNIFLHRGWVFQVECTLWDSALGTPFLVEEHVNQTKSQSSEVAIVGMRCTHILKQLVLLRLGPLSLLATFSVAGNQVRAS